MKKMTRKELIEWLKYFMEQCNYADGYKDENLYENQKNIEKKLELEN